MVVSVVRFLLIRQKLWKPGFRELYMLLGLGKIILILLYVVVEDHLISGLDDCYW